MRYAALGSATAAGISRLVYPLVILKTSLDDESCPGCSPSHEVLHSIFGQMAHEGVSSHHHHQAGCSGDQTSRTPWIREVFSSDWLQELRMPPHWWKGSALAVAAEAGTALSAIARHTQWSSDCRTSHMDQGTCLFSVSNRE